MLKFLLYPLLTLIVQQAFGTDYYLSSQGQDNASGTSVRKPWRNLNQLKTVKLNPGDHIWLRGGDTLEGHIYIENIRSSSGHPFTISSYGSGKAVINAGNGDGIFVRNCAGIVIEQIELAGNGYGINRGTGIRVLNTLPGGVQLPYIRIRKCVAHGFGKEGIFVGSGNYGPLPLPDSSAYEPSDHSQSGFSNVRIEDCTVHSNVYYGIQVTGVWDSKSVQYANRDVLIRQCKAYRNSGDSTFLENHSGSGIFLDDVQHGRIERCIAYNNGFWCNARVGGPCGIWSHAADDVVISRCVSVHNRTGRGIDGAGFDFDAGVSNSVMHHNISGFNDGAGYLLYVYNQAPHQFANNVAHHNISVNDGRRNNYSGFFIRNDGSGLRNTHLHHNRIYQTPSANGQSCGIYVANTIDTQLSENTLVSNGDVPLMRIAPEQKSLVISKNTYIGLDGSVRIDMGIQEPGGAAQVPVYHNLQTWSQTTGYEQEQGRFTGRVRHSRTRFVEQVRNLARQYELK